ncbi:Kinase suppressor of Ras 1 [Halotydeus destructor]|nr:Kinase suppressor of Ras 1 [Halotydeus destructor]
MFNSNGQNGLDVNCDAVAQAIEACTNAQAVIDFSAQNLEGLRTQCSTSSGLTQAEIRTLETKLVKLFSSQLVAKARCPDAAKNTELTIYPRLIQWLRVVGLGNKLCQMIGTKFSSFRHFIHSPESRLKEVLLDSGFATEEDTRKLLTATRNLKAFSERQLLSNSPIIDVDLHWDSWDKSSNNALIASNASGSSPRVHRSKTSRISTTGDVDGKSSPISPPLIAPGKHGHSNPTSPLHGVNGKPNSLPVKDRKPTPPSTPSLTSRKSQHNKFQTTPPPAKRHQANLLSDPFPLTKCKSHEEHLSKRVEPFDKDIVHSIDPTTVNSYSSLPHQQQNVTSRRRLATEPGLSQTSPVISPNRSPPFASPDLTDNCFSDEPFLPVPPRSPRAHGGMVHVIHHRFTTTVKVKMCYLCEKPMFIGYRCKECKYYCHRDCVDKVPPSCGLPNELMNVFKRSIAVNEGRHSPVPSCSGQPNVTSPSSVRSETLGRDRTKRLKGSHLRKPVINIPPFGPPDSSSNTSSCTSSTPSSPALLANSSQTPPSASKPNSFNFDVSSLATVSSQSTDSTKKMTVTDSNSVLSSKDVVASQKSNDSDKTISGASGSTSTDSEKTLAGRIGSQDSQVSDIELNDRIWPRQNSLTSREWDIPFDDVKIEEEIGTGRFGTVFKGQWHGCVAVKRLNMNNGQLDDKKAIEAFRQEVAMFRKTRHENLVLFMGACMKPPHLAIITSLCKGNTLYTHVHVRKDKFTLNRTLLIAQEISQGMSYLHARGIIHKDLKSKNIFYENGKVVITDFGLFCVTKLCHGNRKGDWLTIPKGWLCYLAPEVIRSLKAGDQEGEDLPVSTASDVFAFGTVWYELLFSDWPFKGQPSESIIWQVGKGMKQSLTNLQASKEIKELLMLCWAFKGDERPEFSKLLDTLSRLPKKRLQRSPSHPIQLLRSNESMF